MSDEFGDFSFLVDVDLEEMISRPVPEVEGPPAAAQVAAPPLPVPSPAAHVSSPVAPANPGDQARFSARVLQRNSSPPKKKAKPNLLGGAERWGVRKALPDLSLSRVNLTRLTWEHQQLLVRAHSWAVQRFGLQASSAKLCEATVNCFNHWHQSRLLQVPGGLGGFVTKELVARFLKEQGRAAASRQLAQHIEEPLESPVSVSEDDIDEMGRSELRKLAKQWKVTQNNRSSIQLREDLKKHLRKQP